MRTPALILAATIVPALDSAALAQCPGSWIPIGEVALSTGTAAVNALLPIPNGSGGIDILVGGSFDTAGATVAHCVARYRPSTSEWFSLDGLVITGSVRCFAALPDGDIVIAGTFTTSPGTPANNIVRYHPIDSTWSLLGTGTTNGLRGSLISGGSSIQSLAARPNGDVIAFGSFDTTGALWSIKNAALWSASTSTWSPLGTGFAECYPVNPDCPTLLVHGASAAVRLLNGAILHGGAFSYTSGGYAYNLAMLDPASNTWSSPDPTTSLAINGAVNALAVLPTGDVVIGGGFTSAGGIPAAHVVRWSPTTATWSAMSSGTAQPIASLATALGGHVYAGTSGSPCQLLRWDDATSTWTLIASSSSAFSTISSIAPLPSGDILIGGSFTTTQGGPTVHIARWSTSPTCPPDFNCSGALEIQDIFDFLNAWLSADPHADFNTLNGINTQDIFDFLNTWFAGC